MIMITPSFSTVSASTRTPDRLRRDGFTLVELLVVITIIAIMFAIFTAVVGSMLSRARRSATQATILKIHRVIQSRRDTFSTYQLKQSEILQAMRLIQVNDPQGTFTPRQIRRLAPVVARKLAFRRAFPQNRFEKTLPGNIVSEYDNAELLYWILTTSEDSSSVHFSSSELADNDNDRLPELIDSWGKPLRFYRWPTRLIRPGGIGTAIEPSVAQLVLGSVSKDRFGQDPDESVTELFARWITLQGINGENLFHTPATWHAPLVISSGPDMELGLEEPTDVANRGFWARPYQEPDTNNNNLLDPAEDRNGNNNRDNCVVDRTFLFDNISNYNIQTGGS